ncbi:hypothetical protein Moror_2546 [Moniliophthora roreri MCA 2997]|uniref:Uncharacterized protein n=1 Tax=Moniliophthora roreri (strain MCA 2997) TaxID=1381753 RepID=V2WXR8_MONRO|nr:hypothetical protein Moror_2546 [Moniliophthora roreri MCA 2997]
MFSTPIFKSKPKPPSSQSHSQSQQSQSLSRSQEPLPEGQVEGYPDITRRNRSFRPSDDPEKAQDFSSYTEFRGCREPPRKLGVKGDIFITLPSSTSSANLYARLDHGWKLWEVPKLKWDTINRNKIVDLSDKALKHEGCVLWVTRRQSVDWLTTRALEKRLERGGGRKVVLDTPSDLVKSVLEAERARKRKAPASFSALAGSARKKGKIDILGDDIATAPPALQGGEESISQPATPVRAPPPSSSSDQFVTPRTSPSQPLPPASASTPLRDNNDGDDFMMNRDDLFGDGDVGMGDASVDMGTSSTNPDPTPQRVQVSVAQCEEVQREIEELRHQIFMLQQQQQQQPQSSASFASTTAITKDAVAKEADTSKAQGSSSSSTTTKANEKDQVPEPSVSKSKKASDTLGKRKAEGKPQSQLNNSSVSMVMKTSEGVGIQKETSETQDAQPPAGRKGKEKEQHLVSASILSTTAAKGKGKEATSSTATGAQRKEEEQEQARQRWMEYVQAASGSGGASIPATTQEQDVPKAKAKERPRPKPAYKTASQTRPAALTSTSSSSRLPKEEPKEPALVTSKNTGGSSVQDAIDLTLDSDDESEAPPPPPPPTKAKSRKSISSRSTPASSKSVPPKSRGYPEPIVIDDSDDDVVSAVDSPKGKGKEEVKREAKAEGEGSEKLDQDTTVEQLSTTCSPRWPSSSGTSRPLSSSRITRSPSATSWHVDASDEVDQLDPSSPSHDSGFDECASQRAPSMCTAETPGVKECELLAIKKEPEEVFFPWCLDAEKRDLFIQISFKKSLKGTTFTCPACKKLGLDETEYQFKAVSPSFLIQHIGNKHPDLPAKTWSMDKLREKAVAANEKHMKATKEFLAKSGKKKDG